MLPVFKLQISSTGDLNADAFQIKLRLCSYAVSTPAGLLANDKLHSDQAKMSPAGIMFMTLPCHCWSSMPSFARQP